MCVIAPLPRLETQSGPPSEEGGDTDGGLEIVCEFVVTGCDATPVFEPAKHAFDDVSQLIGIGVERVSALSRRVVRDDRNSSAFAQEEPKAIAVIGRISGAQACRRQQGEQRQDDTKIAVRALLRSQAVGLDRRRQRGSWSYGHPASARSPAPPPPFSARRRAVSLGRGAIDEMNIVGANRHQGAEQLLPQPARRPAVETIIDRGRRPVVRRTVLPTAARLEHINDPTDDTPVVHTAGPRTVLRKKWFDRRPLRIVQPKLACRHLQASKSEP